MSPHPPSDPTIQAISRWWQAFSEQADTIDAFFRQQEQFDLAGWMQQHLKRVHPDLMWEFGPAVNGPGHRLVITPESRRELRPLVRELLRQAPPLPGWEFYEYRLPDPPELLRDVIAARTGEPCCDLVFRAEVGPFRRIDLKFASNLPVEQGDLTLEQAFVALESTLGEEILDRWIGLIELAEEQDPSTAPQRPLSQLKAVLDEEIAKLEELLPESPLAEIVSDEGWTVLELEPEPADEYPGQEDLLVGVTCMPEVWGNALSRVPFDSTRYSRCGERFCYLKLDGSEGLEGSQFADRGEVEEALNAALQPAGFGCVIGGGTGLKYSYIELALSDVRRAWNTIQSIGLVGQLPVRTWLLFHDSDLATQWYGLYDETPPPPLPVSE